MLTGVLSRDQKRQGKAEEGDKHGIQLLTCGEAICVVHVFKEYRKFMTRGFFVIICLTNKKLQSYLELAVPGHALLWLENGNEMEKK